MSKPLFKHAAAWLLALMVALVAAPGMALASDLVAADEGTETGPALTVYTQYADEDPVVAKTFTQADLEDIAAQNTEPLAYVYSGFVSKADKYVTLDQLLKKVGKKGLTVTDEDSVDVAAKDGLTATFTNEQLKAETKFFAGISYDGEKFDYSDLGDAKDAPAILALNEGKTKWKNNTGAAGAALENIETSSDSALQWLCGVTAESVTGDSAALPGGKKAPSGVVSITVKTPASSSFVVYSQEGADAEPVKANEYTRETLEALATAGAKGFLYWGSDVWMVGATTSSVDVAKLIEDAGLKLEDNDTVVLAAPDGFKTTLSAADIQSEKYFYANATETGTDASSPDEVGTVLALNWAAAPVSGTAGQTVTTLTESGLINQYRLFTGVSEENYLAKNAAGKRFATNPKSLTLIKGTSSTPGNDNEAAGNETVNNETAGKDGAAADKAKKLAAASTIGTAKVTAAQIKKASDLGATTITLGSKVKKIAKGAFKGTKVKTIVVKTKKLKKKSVKGSLKGSKVKTVKVQVGSKKANKKVVKKYKKIFTKKNAGKKVKVK